MEQSPSWEVNSCWATQEIPCILWKPKVHYRVHKNETLVPIFSQINPVDIKILIDFNISLPCPSRSSKWSFSFRFSTKTLWHCVTFCNKEPVGYLQWGVLSLPPNFQAEESPLPGLFHYLPNLGVISLFRNLRMCHGVVTKNPLKCLTLNNIFLCHFVFKLFPQN
jgi:hypothetical protein